MGAKHSSPILFGTNSVDTDSEFSEKKQFVIVHLLKIREFLCAPFTQSSKFSSWIEQSEALVPLLETFNLLNREFEALLERVNALEDYRNLLMTIATNKRKVLPNSRIQNIALLSDFLDNYPEICEFFLKEFSKKYSILYQAGMAYLYKANPKQQKLHELNSIKESFRMRCAIPGLFYCKLTDKPLVDVMATPYGYYCEKEALFEILQIQPICPVTKKPLTLNMLLNDEELIKTSKEMTDILRNYYYDRNDMLEKIDDMSFSDIVQLQDVLDFYLTKVRSFYQAFTEKLLHLHTHHLKLEQLKQLQTTPLLTGKSILQNLFPLFARAANQEHVLPRAQSLEKGNILSIFNKP